MNTDAKNALTIVRILATPREKVWRALREREALQQWWGMPTDATMPSCKVDFRVGGSLHCEIAMPGRPNLWFKWIYREIVDGERLVMEQHYSDATGRELDSSERPVSTITLLLEDMNAKTKLTITQVGMASHVHRVEDYQEGWSQSLDRLRAYLV